MNKIELHYFNLLKKQVSATFLEHNNAPSNIKNWKGEEITAFQEDLINKAKGKISEKWFYTYFKNTPEKLPRIDTLNLLSKYIGSTNWNNFKTTNSSKIKNHNNKQRYSLFLLITLLTSIIIYLFIPSNNLFEICLIDAVQNKPITKTHLDIKILQKNESPIYLKTDASGCFTYQTTETNIKFVVQSPYHKTDTIIRSIENNHHNIVKITPDDYALLLEYYANGHVKNREKHKQQLTTLIAIDAKIYQLFKSNIGIELYTKEEFIRFTTLPTNTVKNIKILEKKMKNGKIVKLKFTIQ